MYACYIGHDNIVNLLLDAGVNVNVKNHKGQTPLMLASSCGNESVGYFLVQVCSVLKDQSDMQEQGCILCGAFAVDYTIMPSSLKIFTTNVDIYCRYSMLEEMG